MSESLVRLERLKAVLNARLKDSDSRIKYLQSLAGRKDSYWSDLLRGARPIGEKAARAIEEGLGLPRNTLDDDGWPPDTSAIANAFNRLPTGTPEELAIRRRVYMAIMAMVGASAPTEPSSAAPAPAPPPSPEPDRRG
jgi:hypothetical protein